MQSPSAGRMHRSETGVGFSVGDQWDRTLSNLLDVDGPTAVQAGLEVVGDLLLDLKPTGRILIFARNEAREHLVVAAIGRDETEGLDFVDPFDRAGHLA
jgi:hypothetical protein